VLEPIDLLLFVHCVHFYIVPLHSLLPGEVPEEVSMSFQNTIEYVFLFATLGEDSLAWVPAHWVCGLWVNTTIERPGTGRLLSSLLTKFIRPITKHNTFIVTN